MKIHIKINDSFKIVDGYKKDHKWYMTSTNKVIPNEIIYWISDN